MKEVDDLLEPVYSKNGNCYGHTAHPLFNFGAIFRRPSLMATIQQYSPELLSLIGGIDISYVAGSILMDYLVSGGASAGSDGSVKDRIGGHAFYISDNAFTHAIWGHAQTVGSKREMSSL